jgi:hypothetical protein
MDQKAMMDGLEKWKFCIELDGVYCILFCLLNGIIFKVVLGIGKASCKIGGPILLLLENCSNVPCIKFLGQHFVFQ